MSDTVVVIVRHRPTRHHAGVVAHVRILIERIQDGRPVGTLLRFEQFHAAPEGQSEALLVERRRGLPIRFDGIQIS